MHFHHSGGPYAPAPRQMMLFWFGPAFQGARRSAYESLRATVGVPLHLVTAENIHQYTLPEHPLHPAFEYLSPVHKSDYLFSYFSHHVGGAFHDVKVPFGNWSSWFDVINADHKIWLLGTRLKHRDGVACQEPMAADDPECLALRRTRGENASHWRPVFPEFPTAYINGVFDPFDGTRGACCERVRNNWQHTIDCQQHIARPRTPLTADWLRLAHAALDLKLNALKTHSYPRPRCCMNHENGYPINWAELKGNTLFPMEVKYMKHVNGSMPQKPSAMYRASAEEHF
ncbi:hypothetical protein AB1Y20_008140 [Prymnesium parvum]|uniref:Uncharacterized protein n=1 Tax=Prymnesium parvum TaxID=97485 RepID=A0AB34IVR1_PRYPA